MNILHNIVQKPNINLYQKNSQEKNGINANIFEPIATTSLLKPDRPQRSYIVNDPFYMLPVNFVKDIKENVVNIVRATTGKSNDHDLGRINDFSMKAGALALAGYLFTHGKTSLSRTMEFVGFGSFFASMALWPKLFIQTPLKAMYGVDIHQKYVDNEGRKKMFFQDPQYIPWDLYNDEELSKLGDKLGIPRDVHNRNELIKKKAHKIALQGNTLWMLTAGFATPLMSALICNGFEKIVTPRSERVSFPNNIFGAFSDTIEKMRIDEVEKKLKNIDVIVNEAVSKLDQTSLEAFLNLNKDREVSGKFYADLMKRLNSTDDILESEVLKKQLDAIIPLERIVPQAFESYSDNYFVLFQKQMEKIKNDKELVKQLKELITKEKIKELSVNSTATVEEFLDNIENYIVENIQNEDKQQICIKKVKQVGFDLYKMMTGKEFGAHSDFGINVEVRTLTADAIKKILKLDKNLYEYFIRKETLNDYYRVLMEHVGDSVITNRWINVSKVFYESLGYSRDELKIARTEGVEAINLMKKKVEALTSDESRYNIAMRKIQKAILDFDNMFLPDSAEGYQGIKKDYSLYVDDFAQKCSEMFEKSNFMEFKARLVGDNITNLGSLKSNLLDTMERRVESIRYGMYKLLYSLNFFKSANGLSNLSPEEFEKNLLVRDYKEFPIADYYTEYVNGKKIKSKLNFEFIKERFFRDIEEYKKIILSSTIADHTVKFGMKNPQKGLYARLMSLIYTTNFDESTKKALSLEKNKIKLGDTDFSKSFVKYIEDARYNLGNSSYGHASKVVLDSNGGDVVDALAKDFLLGPKLSEYTRKITSEAYNSSKWLGKFGTMSAVLVGITLLSQVFFGKLSLQDLQYVRKDKN